MKRSISTSCSILVFVLCFISIPFTYSQKESTSFNKTFTVAKGAVLYVDTSHADIEFETWDRNEIAVSASIEIEGASKEESERYFEQESFDISGTSEKVQISTKSTGDASFFKTKEFHVADFEYDIPSIDSVFIEIAELAEMPEFPQKLVPHFDYQAFMEKGEVYMEKWKKQFDSSFDREHQQRMEAWGKRVELRQEAREKRREEHFKRLEVHATNRAKRMEERAEQHSKRMEEAQERGAERAKHHLNDRRSVFISHEDGDSPGVFYFNADGQNKNYKIKKTIKVKMPKNMRIKIKVRHGAVKLAQHTMNMEAELSHSSLSAASIGGDKTLVQASYSPVSIERWELGSLQANYAERVSLKEVVDIKLNTTSSNVRIDKLVKTAFVKNDFGTLEIRSIAKEFSDLDVTLQNAELVFTAPNTAFNIYVNGTSSKVKSLSKITFDNTRNHDNTIQKGYYLNEQGKRSITINAKFSEVNIQ